MIGKRASAILLAMVMTFTIVPTAVMQANAAGPADIVAEGQTSTSSPRESYMNYLNAHATAAQISETVPVDATKLADQESCEIVTIGGRKAVQINQGGRAGWKVNIEKEGLYQITTDYYPILGKPVDIELSIKIDGEVPFTEANILTFRRIWKDSQRLPDRDNIDNEIKPDTEEVSKWITYTVHDNDAMTDANLLFYFKKGEHTITFKSQRESIAFANLTLGGSSSLPSYQDVKAEYDSKDYKTVDADPVLIDAEYPYQKSQQNLMMRSDFSSPSTTPAHPSKIRLNTIGGADWKYPSQWISWEVKVPKDGLYAVTLKYRQDYIRGFKVYRTVYIDDKVPFEEFREVPFEPTTDWENYTISDDKGKPYYVYLTAGQTHTIKLDVTFGPVSETLQMLEQRIYDMNAIYRQIIMITGASPDPLRDYYLDKEIPGLMSTLKGIRKDLNTIARNIEKFNGVKGGEASFVDVVIKQLDNFIKDPRKINTGLSTYKSNTSSLADLMLKMKEQSMLLDSIYVGNAQNVPKARVGFFNSISYYTKAFMASFVEEYNSVGSVYGTGGGYKCAPIDVWIGGAGRDQMSVLKTMVDDKFVPESNIPVNISLVDTGATLTQAILGGAGPDCAMFVDNNLPVNYSMRGALINLEQFPGFAELKKWFFPSAFIALEYEGGTYAVPETQAFQMMFYRTDIFEQLGLTPPNTWDELYACVTQIQRRNMQIGIPPENQGIFQMLLFQNGATYYTDDHKRTRFDDQGAIQAFRQWTDFNNKYSLPLSYDAYNRFRTGEIPLLLESYTFYNNLMVAAPEIKGLWEMAPIPGTPQPNGSINRAQAGSGLCSIMIRGAKNPKYVFDFMKWWVSKDAQTEFGNKIESQLGVGGRYSTANVEAFKLLPWSYTEQQLLLTAWQDVTDIPRIPGDYYVGRMVSNAFRAAVYKKQNPREALLRYNKDINKEIKRKRAEFNLDN